MVGRWRRAGGSGGVGEWKFLTDSKEGEEDGETLFGGPWGYGTDGGHRMNDPDGAEPVGCTAGGKEGRIGGMRG